MTDPLPALRVTSLVEAVSYLFLLGVAMPLKHLYDSPMAVKISGMAHGILFLLLVWLLARAHFERGWPRDRVVKLFLASLVPILPFMLDRRVAAWVAATQPRA